MTEPCMSIAVWHMLFDHLKWFFYDPPWCFQIDWLIMNVLLLFTILLYYTGANVLLMSWFYYTIMLMSDVTFFYCLFMLLFWSTSILVISEHWSQTNLEAFFSCLFFSSCTSINKWSDLYSVFFVFFFFCFCFLCLFLLHSTLLISPIEIIMFDLSVVSI